MRKSLLIIIGFVKKEFAQALRDPVMKVFIFLAPVIQLTLFGYAIDSKFRNIKFAVYYAPADAMARQLSNTVFATGWFIPVKQDRQPEELLQAGNADGVLVMPRNGLMKDFGRNKVVMQLLIDAKNATKARAVDQYIRAIVQRFIASKNAQAPPPVIFDVRVLYNPALETSIFMVPGIMTLIMSLITIIMTSMALAREKELGTFETIIAAPVARWEILIGKAVPFLIIGLIDAVIVVGAGVALFDVPIRGPMVYLVTATVIYIMTTVSVGILISTIAQNQQQAMMGTFMFEFPAILLSGVMFPVENMPGAMRAIADINPLMYYVKLVRNIMLKGANPDLVLSNTALLLALGIIVMVFAVMRFRQTLN